MKRTMLCVVAAVGILMLLGTSPKQDETDEILTKAITELRATVADLGLRVDRLEHAAGGTADVGSGTPPEGVRTMILTSISQAANDGDNAEEIGRLKRQCAALMNTVNAAYDETAHDMGQQIYAAHVRGGVRGWAGGVGGGISTTNRGAVRREVRADRMIESRYATLHSIKKKELEALQHAENEPKQIIVGHDGDTIIVLETKHNLSSHLGEIKIGDTISWRGTRLSADADSETWLISMVSKTAAE